MAAVFEAAAAKVREAGGVLAGGHTIRDPEPKYGLAVIGAAHPDRLLRKGGARPGDVLLLTKRLGTGLLVSGRRSGQTTDADLEAAIDQMRTLNRAASEVLVRHGIRGATDVTGFGLLGHGLEMARASGARLVFEAAALPALDGALDLARAGVETGGAGHNRRFTAPSLVVAAGVAPELVALAHDPQTSGGLLAAIPAADAAAVMDALAAAGVPAWRVGAVEAGDARRRAPVGGAARRRAWGGTPAGRGGARGGGLGRRLAADRRGRAEVAAHRPRVLSSPRTSRRSTPGRRRASSASPGSARAGPGCRRWPCRRPDRRRPPRGTASGRS